MTQRRHDVDDSVPCALRGAIARRWRGLTIVTGSGAGRPVTLVRAADAEAPGIYSEQVRVGVCTRGSAPAPDRLVL